jgi:hypothetical protein
MDEILGGQYLGTAKPFNVLNPSGISGEQSLATITAVGEGNRNRAAQSAAQQRQIAAAQEAQNKEMEHNALEAEKDRQLQQKRWKDEQWFRDRSERLAMLYQDHETEMERLRDTEMLDLSQAQDEQISQYLTKRSEIEARKSEVGRRIQGLELLNKMREGIFSKDFRNEKGSMGADLFVLGLGQVQHLGVPKPFHFRLVVLVEHGEPFAPVPEPLFIFPPLLLELPVLLGLQRIVLHLLVLGFLSCRDLSLLGRGLGRPVPVPLPDRRDGGERLLPRDPARVEHVERLGRPQVLSAQNLVHDCLLSA